MNNPEIKTLKEYAQEFNKIYAEQTDKLVCDIILEGSGFTIKERKFDYDIGIYAIQITGINISQPPKVCMLRIFTNEVQLLAPEGYGFIDTKGYIYTALLNGLSSMNDLLIFTTPEIIREKTNTLCVELSSKVDIEKAQFIINFHYKKLFK